MSEWVRSAVRALTDGAAWTGQLAAPGRDRPDVIVGLAAGSGNPPKVDWLSDWTSRYLEDLAHQGRWVDLLGHLHRASSTRRARESQAQCGEVAALLEGFWINAVWWWSSFPELLDTCTRADGRFEFRLHDLGQAAEVWRSGARRAAADAFWSWPYPCVLRLLQTAGRMQHRTCPQCGAVRTVEVADHAFRVEVRRADRPPRAEPLSRSERELVGPLGVFSSIDFALRDAHL